MEENLFYYEVSAKKNDGISKMMYSVISELQMFNEYGIKKDKIAEELEINNQPNLNVSVLTGIKADVEGNQHENNHRDRDINIKVSGGGDKSKRCKC